MTSSLAGRFSAARTGGGVSATAPITITKARIRTTMPSVSSGSGSPKTIGPAAIVTTLAAALVTAITVTASPTCSERALTSRP